MDKIMDVYIANADVSLASEAHTVLSLPATPFALFDALDKARVQAGDELYFQVEEYHAFECMEPFTTDADNLLELNSLCQKLSELDARQTAAFEGLLQMESAQKDGPVSVGTLIDLAYSTDRCHVLDAVQSDAQLGRFYAENGFVAGADGLQDKMFNLLDFERIGREQRLAEGGVFTAHGYVVQHSELAQAYQTMSFHMRTPDYQVLLELADGSRLELPCTALPEEASFHCVDCRVPSLVDAITDVKDISAVNSFAEMLKSMGDRPMRKYKAILDATACGTLEEAGALATHMDEFTFDEAVSSFRELGMESLRRMMNDHDAALLAQYTSLHSYGMALQERDHSVISQYGLVAQCDHQPIQAETMAEKQFEMEM